MKLIPLGELHLTYVGPSIGFVDYGVGGQYYAFMEGTWTGEQINGRLRLTNVAQKRPDNLNTPTLRGMLETEDGASMFVEMDGLSQIQEGGRVFITTVRLRTGHPGYEWVNSMFAVMEGELHGVPRPNEFRARCRVYRCEANITPSTPSKEGERSMQVNAYVLPVLTGRENDLLAATREMSSRTKELDEHLHKRGVSRQAGFLQVTPRGSQVIVYEESTSPTGTGVADGAFAHWLAERMTTVHGFDPTQAPEPKVELLVGHRPHGRGKLYAAVLPVLPGKTARLHEWAMELNGIHAGEFEESLRRLGFGLTLFIQHTPQGDLAISVVEGDEPAAALSRLVASTHPFDRWHVQQIADQTGIDFSVSPPPNHELWSWEATTSARSA